MDGSRRDHQREANEDVENGDKQDSPFTQKHPLVVGVGSGHCGPQPVAVVVPGLSGSVTVEGVGCCAALGELWAARHSLPGWAERGRGCSASPGAAAGWCRCFGVIL